MDRLGDLKGSRRSSEAGEGDGVVLRLLSVRMARIQQSGLPGLHPKLVFSVPSDTTASRAARLLYFDSLVSELFLEAL